MENWDATVPFRSQAYMEGPVKNRDSQIALWRILFDAPEDALDSQQVSRHNPWLSYLRPIAVYQYS